MVRFKHFLDSNVVLYLLSQDSVKADCAQRLLEGSRQAQPVISVQVLNEVTQVCVRKLAMGWDEVAQFLVPLRHYCRVVPLTESVHDDARELAERYRLSFYDACIVAAARASGCTTLYSEDMQHGLRIAGTLDIVNPFVSIVSARAFKP